MQAVPWAYSPKRASVNFVNGTSLSWQGILGSGLSYVKAGRLGMSKESGLIKYSALILKS